MFDWGEIQRDLAAAGTLAGAAISYFVGLGLLTVLFSIAFGSTLTFLVTSRTQRAAWRREGGLRKVDVIYGPLFDEVNLVSKTLYQDGKPNLGLNFTSPGKATWDKVKSGYLYFLIEPKLRGRLEQFYALFGELDEDKSGYLGLVEEKLFANLRKEFGDSVVGATYQVTAKTRLGLPANFSTEMLTFAAMEGVHPIERATKQYPGYTDLELSVYIQSKSGSNSELFGQKVKDEAARHKFDIAFANTVAEINIDLKVIKIRNKIQKLDATSQSIREDLRLVIEEPWRT